MAKSAFNLGAGFGTGARKTSLLDRAVSNLSDTASGFFPGVATIGQTVASDAIKLTQGKTSGFGLDNLGKDMASGFMKSSFIPALFSGHPMEALQRASDRPVDALFDATLGFPAYRGAAMGAARAGHVMGDAGLMEWGTRAQGLTRMAPEVRGMFDNYVGDFNSLPATLPTFDGGSLLTREVAPFRPGSVKSYGDDLYMKRVKRTLPLGPAPKVEGMEINQEQWDKFGLNRDDLAGKTLGEDGWRNVTSYRADNEQLAKLGDLFSSKIAGSVPAFQKFSAAGRIGRKATMAEYKDLTSDVDPKIIEEQDLLGKVRADLKLKPELAGLDDAELNDIAANLVFGRAMTGDGSQLEDVIRSHDPSAAYNGLSHEDFRAIPFNEAAARGFRIEKTENGYTSPDPSTGNYATIGDFLDANREALLRRKPHAEDPAKLVSDSPYQIRVLSDRHRQASQDIDAQTNEMINKLHELIDQYPDTGVRPLVRNLAEQDAPARYLDREPGDDRINMADPVEARAIMDKIANDPNYRLDFELNEKILTDYQEILRATGTHSDMDFDQILKDSKGMVEPESALRQQVKAFLNNYRKSKGEAQNFDNHSPWYLNHRGLLDEAPQFRETKSSRKPGIVDRLEQIRSNPHLKHVDVNSPALQALFKHLDSVRDEGGANYQELVGKTLLSDDKVTVNRARLAEFAHGKNATVEPEGNGFYPMVRDAKMKPGSFIAQDRETFIDRPDGKPFTDKKPGDPHELFLTGDFRVDAKVIMDDFKKNRQILASEKLMKRLDGMAMTISKQEAIELAKSGHLIDSRNLDKAAQGSFVVLERNDVMSSLARELHPLLEEFVLAARKNGDKIGEDRFRAAAHTARQADYGAPDLDPTSHAKHPDTHTDELGDEIRVLPTEIYNAAYKEMQAGQAAVGSLYRMVQDGWKTMVLHARFLQWMRNNFIGAQLMAAVTGGAHRYMRDIGAIISRNPEMVEKMKLMGASDNADFLGAGSGSLARMNSREMLKGDELSGLQKARQKYATGVNYMSDINTKYADDPVRKMNMMWNMEDQLGALKEITGNDIKLTPEMVQKFIDDEGLRRELARRTNTELVDFSDMSAFEKKWLVSIFPFWSWMKGSSKAGARLWADKPGTVASLAAVGEVGNEHMHDQHGKFVPDFAKSMWDPGEAGGLALNTAGFLPYQTPIDFALTAGGLMPDLIPGDRSSSMSYRQYGSENLISNLNPLLSGGIQAATGRNVYFGTPIPNKSFGSTFMEAQAGLPLIKLMQTLYENKTGPDATAVTSRPMTIGNYLGGSLRDPRWGQLTNRGVSELQERYKNAAAVNELVPHA